MCCWVVRQLEMTWYFLVLNNFTVKRILRAWCVWLYILLGKRDYWDSASCNLQFKNATPLRCKSSCNRLESDAYQPIHGLLMLWYPSIIVIYIFIPHCIFFSYVYKIIIRWKSTQFINFLCLLWIFQIRSVSSRTGLYLFADTPHLLLRSYLGSGFILEIKKKQIFTKRDYFFRKKKRNRTNGTVSWCVVFMEPHRWCDFSNFQMLNLLTT